MDLLKAVGVEWGGGKAGKGEMVELAGKQINKQTTKQTNRETTITTTKM